MERLDRDITEELIEQARSGGVVFDPNDEPPRLPRRRGLEEGAALRPSGSVRTDVGVRSRDLGAPGVLEAADTRSQNRKLRDGDPIIGSVNGKRMI